MYRKRINIIVVTVTIFLIAFFIATNLITKRDTINWDAENEQRDINETNPYANAELTIMIIPAPNNTYGYNITMEGRTLIHQPNAPALPGVEGFKTREDAQKVAEFVVQKIRTNVFPPSVSVAELDSLGVLRNKKM